jgi:hypothetical protein
VGPRLAWWPLEVRRAASAINEWQPTVLAEGFALVFAVIVGIIVLAWGRSEGRTPLEEQLFVLGTTAAAMAAGRNVAPAVLLLVPFLLKALDGVGLGDFSLPKFLGPASVAAGVIGALAHLVTAPTTSPQLPTRIAETLAARTTETRVLNDYNLGGFLTGRAGPHERVAIDGRTDIWPEQFVRTYVDAMNGQGDWRGLVETLKPNAAVLPRNSEVARGLVNEDGWRITMREWHWVLLEPRR